MSVIIMFAEQRRFTGNKPLDQKIGYSVSKILLTCIIAIFALTGCPSSQLTEEEPVRGTAYHEVSRSEYVRAMKVVKSGAKGRKLAHAATTLGYYFFGKRDFKAASDEFMKVIQVSPDKDPAAIAQFMLGNCFFEGEYYPAAISAFNKVVEGYTNEDLVFKANNFIQTILDVKISLEELTLVEKNYRDKVFYSRMLFQIGKKYYQLDDCDHATNYFKAFLARYPNNPDFEEVKWMMDGCQGTLRLSSRKIGGLFPLTGSLKTYGEMMRNGVELAIEEYNAGKKSRDRAVLIVGDTFGSGLQAIKSTRRLIEEEKVMVLIGPASSGSLAAVANIVDAAKVPLITPSAGELGYSALSSYIFRNHLILSEEGRQLANCVIKDRGLRRIAVLAPDSKYGRTIGAAFKSAVENAGGVVLLEKYYKPGSKTFRAEMTALGGTDPSDIKHYKRFSNDQFKNAVYNLRIKLVSAMPEENVLFAVNVFRAQGSKAKERKFGRVVTKNLIRDLKREKNVTVVELSEVERTRREKGLEVEMIDDLSKISAILDFGRSLEAGLVAVGEVHADEWELEENDGLDSEGDAVTDAAEPVTGTAVVMPDKPYEETKFEINMQVIDVRHGEIILTVSERFVQRELIESNPLGVEAVFMPAQSMNEVLLLAPMLRHYELDMQIIGNSQWGNKSVRRVITTALEGVLYIDGFYARSANPDVKKFVEAFEKKYLVMPDQYAAQAYDAVRVVLKAMEKSGGSRARLTQMIRKTKDFDGVSGKILSFDRNGDAVKELPILEIRGGRLIERIGGCGDNPEE